MTDQPQPREEQGATGASRRLGRWLLASTVLVVLTAAGLGWYVWDQLQVPEVTVSYLVPPAERLTADSPSESLYRVDPTKSTVTYSVEESVAGVSRTAEGSTSGIAGDVVINEDTPDESRFGEIVVNVEQFRSDQDLRDNRIRHDFLQSTRYKTTRFEPTEVDGLPEEIEDDTEYPIQVTGDLTVKELTEPVTVDGTAVRTDDEVHVEMSTTLQMSTFEIGPIELIGFIRTGDDVQLDFDLVFVDPQQVEIPTVLSVSEEVDGGSSGDGPQFSEEVMPILANSCAGCHGANGVGSDVWSLETAGDAADVAEGLALVTESRYMPPWPASEQSAAFQHDRSLTTQEITAITRWADSGGALDVERSTPIDPPDVDGPEISHDLTLTYPQPYQGSLAKPNDYRCFLLDPGFTETTWMSGYQLDPDEDEVVHHVLGFRVDDKERQRLTDVDASSEGSGWNCSDDLRMQDQFMAWAPGQEPTRFPEGSAMAFAPGEAVMLQVHYHYVHDVPADRSSIHFELYNNEAPPAEVGYDVYVGPAEIPCRDGIEVGALCDRELAQADLLERVGISSAIIPDGLLMRCGYEASDFSAMTTGVAKSTCDLPVAEDTDAIAVFGHLHEIGDAFRLTLNPDTDDEHVLLDIPTWNFDWQLNYAFKNPVELSAGDTIRVECTWDRAHLAIPEARYIMFSDRTEDEMCYSAITTVPR